MPWILRENLMEQDDEGNWYAFGVFHQNFLPLRYGRNAFPSGAVDSVLRAAVDHAQEFPPDLGNDYYEVIWKNDAAEGYEWISIRRTELNVNPGGEILSLEWIEPTALEQAVIELRAEGLLPQGKYRNDDYEQFGELEDAWREAFPEVFLPIQWSTRDGLLWDEQLHRLFRAWHAKHGEPSGSSGLLGIALLSLGLLALRRRSKLG